MIHYKSQKFFKLKKNNQVQENSHVSLQNYRGKEQNRQYHGCGLWECCRRLFPNQEKRAVARWFRCLPFNTNEAVEEAVAFLSQRQKLKHTKPCQRKTGQDQDHQGIFFKQNLDYFLIQKKIKRQEVESIIHDILENLNSFGMAWGSHTLAEKLSTNWS